MAVKKFPPVELADENGLLAVGGDLEIPSLHLAYQSGIFPWPIAGFDRLAWFSPPERAVLFLKDLHISRSLQRALRLTRWKFSLNTAFEDVIRGCARTRGDARGTWITDDVIAAYCDFHDAGFAHSVECFDGSRLIGGMYGVAIGKMFAGESMFYLESNASKLCLVFFALYLKRLGIGWIDCQVITPHLQAFGATEIERPEFLNLLRDVVSKEQLSLSNEEFVKTIIAAKR